MSGQIPGSQPYLRRGKWLLAPKQPHWAFGQYPDCQLGRKALQSPLLPFLLLLCTAWVIRVLIDPSGLTLSQEICWNKIRQVYSCATEWLSSRCWQAPPEGLQPACHQAQMLTSSSPPSTLNATYGSDAEVVIPSWYHVSIMFQAEWPFQCNQISPIWLAGWWSFHSFNGWSLSIVKLPFTNCPYN